MSLLLAKNIHLFSIFIAIIIVDIHNCVDLLREYKFSRLIFFLSRFDSILYKFLWNYDITCDILNL